VPDQSIPLGVSVGGQLQGLNLIGTRARLELTDQELASLDPIGRSLACSPIVMIRRILEQKVLPNAHTPEEALSLLSQFDQWTFQATPPAQKTIALSPSHPTLRRSLEVGLKRIYEGFMTEAATSIRPQQRESGRAGLPPAWMIAADQSLSMPSGTS
jgi:hypothetical protein